MNTDTIFKFPAKLLYDIFESLPVGLTICTQNGFYLKVNESYCKLTGYTKDELLTMSFRQITHPDDLAKDLEMVGKLLEGKLSAYTLEKRYICKDKSLIWIKIHATFIYDESNNTKLLIGTTENITQLKYAQDAIKKMHEIVTYIITNASGKSGMNYFNAITLALCETLNADFAHIGILQSDKQHIKTIALCKRGEILPNIEYNLPGTPCETVIDQFTKSFQRNVTKLFPNEMLLQQMQIDGYIGVPLYYKSGAPLGIMVCLFKNPIADTQLAETVINLFSDRAVVEYEQMQYQEELIIARNKAEENDHLKTSFLQNMSHEIRTPMNAIMGFAEILPGCINNKEKLEKFSTIIRQSGANLIEIINDILDISKIESGQLPIHMEKCNLLDMFDEIDDFFIEYRNRINKQHIKFQKNLKCDALPQQIIIDQGKLKQILMNLIGNALKFTKEGKVEVGCNKSDNNLLSIYVTDTGIGIPKNKHTEIFSRFIQADNNISKQYGGNGLGLAIVKGLLDLMGGKISMKSEEGSGTTFDILLPFETQSIVS